MRTVRNLLLVAILMGSLSGPLLASDALSTVTIDLPPCTGFAGAHHAPEAIESASAKVEPFPTLSLPVQQTFASGPEGHATLTLRLPPGHYGVRILAADCVAWVFPSIIPGHDRSFVADWSKGGTIWEVHAAVAGTLPARVKSVELVPVRQYGEPINAVIQGGAYYVDYLGFGFDRYIAILHGETKSEDATIGFDFTDQRIDSVQIHNISSAEYDRARARSGSPFRRRSCGATTVPCGFSIPAATASGASTREDPYGPLPYRRSTRCPAISLPERAPHGSRRTGR